MNQVTLPLSSPRPRSPLLSIEKQYRGRGMTFSYIKLRACLFSLLFSLRQMRMNAPSAARRPGSAE